ncbi:MAG: hypothetical protein M1818_000448 [Claussenomyces sp. TS43310]|nr:MAG: hypothetical protein M1818_000448 [Claussenomyces sp. TS43310]
MELAAEIAPQTIMDDKDAKDALLALFFSGEMRPSNGKGVGCSLLEATQIGFTYIAALEDEESTNNPTHRYRVYIDRLSRRIQTPLLITLSEAELRECSLTELSVFHTKSRFKEDTDIQYVIQLRHHGNVTSMNLLMNLLLNLISAILNPSVLPLPAVYLNPSEEQQQKETGFGIQITRLISGPMASSVYPQILHKDKLIFV